MRAGFRGLSWLHEVRARLWTVTGHAGLDLPSRQRALHAVHEASVLACEVVDDTVPPATGRHAGDDDRHCTIEAVATRSYLRAEIVLPPGAGLGVARRAQDSLRFVRLFSDDAAWSPGPGPSRLTVVVRAEPLVEALVASR